MRPNNALEPAAASGRRSLNPLLPLLSAGSLGIREMP